MKKFLIVTAIAGIMALTSNESHAQVSINVNIGAQPTWVPSGYQSVDYYYLPEVQSYYYVPERRFVYYQNNAWVRSAHLPSRYRNYDLNRGRIEVYRGTPNFGYRGARPYRVVETRNYHDNGNHYGQYKKFKGNKDWKEDRGRGYGRDRDDDRGRGHGKGKH